MRFVVYLAALLVLMPCTGCFWRRHKSTPPPAVVNASPATNAPSSVDTFAITSDVGLNGRVSSVNAGLRFVVLTFPVGQVPGRDAKLNIYHNGNKVGEVKITGPARDDNTVADIISGDAETGDEVREK
jgi:hypothetical protein